MPWFKVDDKLHDHRKSRAAKKSAMGVWVLAGSWSMDNLTDGFVPVPVAKRWGTSHDFTALVSVGLWESATRDGERGYQFVNWSEFQPTKADVERDRAKKAEAGRKGGIKSGASRREASALADASALVEPPYPTRTLDASDEASSADKPRTTIAKALPADWQPSEAHARLAADRSVDVTEEADKFRDWCASNGTTKKDWEATFRNWLRNARPTPGNVRRLRTDDQGREILPPLPPRSPWGDA